jgi:hypothetical protein
MDTGYPQILSIAIDGTVTELTGQLQGGFLELELLLNQDQNVRWDLLSIHSL